MYTAFHCFDYVLEISTATDNKLPTLTIAGPVDREARESHNKAEQSLCLAVSAVGTSQQKYCGDSWPTNQCLPATLCVSICEDHLYSGRHIVLFMCVPQYNHAQYQFMSKYLRFNCVGGFIQIQHKGCRTHKGHCGLPARGRSCLSAHMYTASLSLQSHIYALTGNTHSAIVAWLVQLLVLCGSPVWSVSVVLWAPLFPRVPELSRAATW